MSFTPRLFSAAAISSLLMLGLALPAVAWGQNANPFVGKWTVNWQGKSRPLQADLVITESGGTWKTFSQSRDDPCVGREAPVEIRAVDTKTLKLSVRHSEAVQGCKDTQVELELIDAQRATGKRGEIGLALTRK